MCDNAYVGINLRFAMPPHVVCKLYAAAFMETVAATTGRSGVLSNQQDQATNTFRVDHSVKSHSLRDKDNSQGQPTDNVSDDAEAESDAEIQKTTTFKCPDPHKDFSCDALEHFKSNALKVDLSQRTETTATTRAVATISL